MKKTLIVVDMQNDFITGSLGSREAVAIVENVKKKVSLYKESGDEIIFTRDTHFEDYLQTQEGRKLPVVHCVKGTHGWQIADGVYCEGSKIIDKTSFGYTGWGEFDFEKIELCGLCTDICVVSNALILKALFPQAEISVDPSCCAGVTPEKNLAALETMRSCQIDC